MSKSLCASTSRQLQCATDLVWWGSECAAPAAKMVRPPKKKKKEKKDDSTWITRREMEGFPFCKKMWCIFAPFAFFFARCLFSHVNLNYVSYSAIIPQIKRTIRNPSPPPHFADKPGTAWLTVRTLRFFASAAARNVAGELFRFACFDQYQFHSGTRCFFLSGGSVAHSAHRLLRHLRRWLRLNWTELLLCASVHSWGF